MGPLTRALVPRGVRRAIHPARTVKKMQRQLHPVSNAIYSAERSLNSKPRKRTRSTLQESEEQFVINLTTLSEEYTGQFAEKMGTTFQVSTCEQAPSNPWAVIITGSDPEGNWYRQQMRVIPGGSWTADLQEVENSKTQEEGSIEVTTMNDGWKIVPTEAAIQQVATAP